MKIAAFTKYDRQAASTRQRLLQYIPALEQAGFEIRHKPLLDDEYVSSLATNEPYSKLSVARSYARRFRDLLGQSDADLVWVYAELFPFLPSGAEKLAFALKKPVVYDFDDAFFHQYDDHRSPLVRRLLGGKLRPLLSGASACLCGNAYLQSYALDFCERSVILPTVVDTASYRPGARPVGSPPVIGWIGSPSTWRYVKPLLPSLAEVCRSSGATFRAVGAGAAARADQFPGLELVDWQEANEISDVQSMDIGIMPVPDEPFARGKSGYKLVQYGACGLPVVASAVGVNSEIVVDGKTGFLAQTPADWSHHLVRLLRDEALRARMGAAGRERITQAYSLAAHAPRFIEVLNAAAGRRG